MTLATRVRTVCPVSESHGKVYDWPGERWSFYCPNQSHDGWGETPTTRAFFTTREVQQGYLDGSQLPTATPTAIAAPEAVLGPQGANQRPVVTGALDTTVDGSGTVEPQAVQRDREAVRRALPPLRAPQASGGARVPGTAGLSHELRL